MHLIAAFLGCLIAAVATGMLAVRCRRVPGIAVVAWAVAAAGLTASLAAQAIGAHNGYGTGAFRVMELGAAVVAPLALCLGLAEVAGRTLAVRFAARLLLPALAIIALVVLGTDPLSGTAFTMAWPAPGTYYQIIPNLLLADALAPATALVAVLAIACTALRARRVPAWRPAAGPVWAAGLAALLLALPGLYALLAGHGKITSSVGPAFVLFCLAAAVLAWLAGARLGRVRLAEIHDGAAAPDHGPGPGEWEDTGAWPAYDRQAGPGEADGDEGYDDEDYPAAAGSGYAPYPPQDGYPGAGQPVNGSGGPQWDEPGYDEAGRYDEADQQEDSGQAPPGAPGYGPPGPQARDENGYGDENGYYAGLFRPGPAPAGRGAAEPGMAGLSGADARARERMFGQITIYTLLEDRVADFDELADRLVEQVMAAEPDTLAYILHAVPSAPMQRILYEVYRDRAAYEGHRHQPHNMRFEHDRAPLVLATNVIELGLQQAKVLPFPTVSDLFGEPAYDTSGFERPDFRNAPPLPVRSDEMPGSPR